MDIPHDRRHDPRDVDAEFARMLAGEGLEVPPGEAPREPAAAEHHRDDEGPLDGDVDDGLWTFSADSPPEPPSDRDRARSRAAHPAAGGMGASGIRGAAGPRELDDDEVVYGDFEAPDPDLPEPASAILWSWTALVAGFLLLMAVAVTPALPQWLGWIGAAAAVGGVISLLMRVPRSRDEDDDGAQV
jgi:hypothetical protein